MQGRRASAHPAADVEALEELEPELLEDDQDELPTIRRSSEFTAYAREVEEILAQGGDPADLVALLAQDRPTVRAMAAAPEPPHPSPSPPRRSSSPK